MKHLNIIMAIVVISLILPGAYASQESPADIDAIFLKAKAHIHQREWRSAADRFDQLLTLLPQGDRQAECFYWLAYALNRMPGDAEESLKRRARAATLLETMLRRYPEGAWSRQARALLIDVSSSLAQSGLQHYSTRLRELSTQLKELDLKLLALDSLMETDVKTATARLKEILESDQNADKRSLALMIMSRHGAPGMQGLLVKLVRREAETKLGLTALVSLLHLAPKRGLREMERILDSDVDVSRKKSLLALFLQFENAGDHLLQVARNQDQPPDIRTRALVLLAQTGAPGTVKHIIDLYAAFERPANRRQIANALGFIQSAAAAQALIRLYAQEDNTDVRSAILLALGRTQQQSARRFLQKILEQ